MSSTEPTSITEAKTNAIWAAGAVTALVMFGLTVRLLLNFAGPVPEDADSYATGPITGGMRFPSAITSVWHQLFVAIWVGAAIYAIASLVVALVKLRKATRAATADVSASPVDL